MDPLSPWAAYPVEFAPSGLTRYCSEHFDRFECIHFRRGGRDRFARRRYRKISQARGTARDIKPPRTTSRGVGHGKTRNEPAWSADYALRPLMKLTTVLSAPRKRDSRKKSAHAPTPSARTPVWTLLYDGIRSGGEEREPRYKRV